LWDAAAGREIRVRGDNMYRSTMTF